MNDNIQQIIKQRLNELPPDIREAIKSGNLAQKFSSIAEKHNLHLDQNGSLQTETMLVMLGLEPTEDYVNNLERELETSKNEAMAIAEDINKNIFSDIRESLRKMQTQNEVVDNTQQEIPSKTSVQSPKSQPIPPPPSNPNLSPLEKAGGFEIINNKPTSFSPQYKDSSLNKDQVLKDIENPPSKVSFVDHLLANPATPPKPPTPEPPKKSPAIDPYREPIE